MFSSVSSRARTCLPVCLHKYKQLSQLRMYMTSFQWEFSWVYFIVNYCLPFLFVIIVGSCFRSWCRSPCSLSLSFFWSFSFHWPRFLFSAGCNVENCSFSTHSELVEKFSIAQFSVEFYFANSLFGNALPLFMSLAWNYYWFLVCIVLSCEWNSNFVIEIGLCCSFEKDDGGKWFDHFPDLPWNFERSKLKFCRTKGTFRIHFEITRVCWHLNTHLTASAPQNESYF